MYQSLEASLHDAFWDSEGEADELQLIQTFLEKHTQPTMELGCGSGRLMLPLIEQGFQVHGVDNSQDMLDLLKLNAEKKGLESQAELGSLNNFTAPADLGSILIPAFTLQLVSRDKAIDCLQRCRQSVSTGGGLYFTVFIPWAEITGDLPEGKFYPDHKAQLAEGAQAHCMTKHSINRLEQSLERNHRYALTDSKGKQQRHNSTQTLQWYHKNELELILQLTGWETNSLVTNFTANDQIDTDSQILTFFCHAI